MFEQKKTKQNEQNMQKCVEQSPEMGIKPVIFIISYLTAFSTSSIKTSPYLTSLGYLQPTVDASGKPSLAT